MERIKKLFPQDKHLRLSVIFFALGLVVRVVLFILSDISSFSVDTYGRPDKNLGGMATLLAVGNPILVFISMFIINAVGKIIGTIVSTLTSTIICQLINLAADILILTAFYKLDKCFSSTVKLFSTIYALSYIIGLVFGGLIFFQVPFNMLTLIAAFTFYRYRVPEIEAENEEGLSK